MENIYPINGLFFYRLVFMALLIIAEGMFLFKMPRKKHFWLKASAGILLCFLFALAFPIPTSNDFYSMMMFFMMFLFTYGVCFFLFQISWQMLLFLLICSYTTEHISYEIYSALSNFFISGDLKPGGLYNYDSIQMFSSTLDFVFWLVSFINVYWIVFVFLARKIENREIFPTNESLYILIIGALFIVIDIVMNSVVNFYSSVHFERIYIGLISTINAFCCIFGLLFIYEMYYRGTLKQEFEIMKKIRKEEKNQYQMSKATIDMINIKCHDFKHQIRSFGKAQNIDEKAINSLNSLISIYDSTMKTSNEALNVTLSEKSLSCSNLGIRFSCMVNGDLLSFMEDEDIYSLFGNILDNAIEAVKELVPEQRVITLKVFSKGNIVSISEKNPYTGKLNMQNGLPLTTKKDKGYHGFGLKSINVVKDKYKGSLELHTEDNIFSISLLFIKRSK